MKTQNKMISKGQRCKEKDVCRISCEGTQALSNLSDEFFFWGGAVWFKMACRSMKINESQRFGWESKDIQQITSSSLIMLLTSPQNLRAWASAWLIIFFFASSSLWQPNYHFQQYPDMQIEYCTQQCNFFFWQVGGSWDVCVGRHFLSLFPFCFSQNYGEAHYVVGVSELKWVERGKGEQAKYLRNIQKGVHLLHNEGNNYI